MIPAPTPPIPQEWEKQVPAWALLPYPEVVALCQALTTSDRVALSVPTILGALGITFLQAEERAAGLLVPTRWLTEPQEP